MATMGRPLKYKTAEELQLAVDVYFQECRAKEVPPTVSGLAYALGFDSRKSLLNYEARPAFTTIVKAAKLQIEASFEQRLAGANPTGAIFNLKCNFGWTETAPVQEVHTKHYAEGDTIKKYRAWLEE